MILIPWDVWKRKRDHVAVLDDEFDTWRNNFEDIADYMAPRDYQSLTTTGGFHGSNRYHISESRRGLQATRSGRAHRRDGRPGAGRARNEKILNGTATKAMVDCGAAFKDSAISPARPWMSLVSGFVPRPGEDDPEVGSESRDWLERTAKIMMMVTSSSNFDVMGQQLFLELAGFANSCFIIEEDEEEFVRLFHSPVGEFRWTLDSRRRVNGLVRIFSMSTEQLVERFGIENVSDQTARNYAEGGAKLDWQVLVVHKLEPNSEDMDRAMLFGDNADQYAYREFYWEHKSNPRGGVRSGRGAGFTAQRRYRDGQSFAQMLSFGGYEEFPVLAGRWRVSGTDTYAVGPSFDCLPDVKQLQRMELMKGQLISIEANPPMQAPASVQHNLQGIANPWLPGTTIFTLEPNAKIGPVRTTNYPLNAVSAEIRALEQRIMKSFYLDLFLSVTQLDTVRSATEIQERREEKLVLLGGPLEHLQREALDVYVKRLFGILSRRGKIDEPPDELKEVGWRPKYHSVLSAAQLASGVANIERFFRMATEVGQVDPSSLFVVKYSELLRMYGSQLSIPSVVFRSAEEVAEIEAAQRAQQQAEAALVEAQTGQNLAGALSGLARTRTGQGGGP